MERVQKFVERKFQASMYPTHDEPKGNGKKRSNPEPGVFSRPPSGYEKKNINMPKQAGRQAGNGPPGDFHMAFTDGVDVYLGCGQSECFRGEGKYNDPNFSSTKMRQMRRDGNEEKGSNALRYYFSRGSRKNHIRIVSLLILVPIQTSLGPRPQFEH